MMKGMLAVLFLLLHSVPNVFGQTAAQLAIIAAMPSCGVSFPSAYHNFGEWN